MYRQCDVLINCSGCKEPMQLLDELSWQQSTTAADVARLQTSSSSSSASHWMIQFPSQCVLTIDAVLWERSVRDAIENGEKQGLKANR